MDVLRQRQGAGRFNHHTPMGKGQSLAPLVLADIRGTATIWSLLDQSGQRSILGRDGLSAFDPNATFNT
jgi:hypothetical protein